MVERSETEPIDAAKIAAENPLVDLKQVEEVRRALAELGPHGEVTTRTPEPRPHPLAGPPLELQRQARRD